MQFFKRILQQSDDMVAPEKRRGGQRLAVNPEFPLRTGLSFAGRAWKGKGALVNCSEKGALLHLAGSVEAAPGATCELRLDLEDFVLEVPCRISNQRRVGEGMSLGLTQLIADPETLLAYRQFVEIVALGATLRPHLRKHLPAGSAYLVEQYAGERRSCLNVWRHPSNDAVAAAEFLLKDCLVRMVAGQRLEYYAGAEAKETLRAAGHQALEIHRLFHWVVPNLSATVPEDLRKFLRTYAG